MADPRPDPAQLTREAYALLREGKHDEALRVAATLEELCYTSCFEIANRCKRFEAALELLDPITAVHLAMEAVATRTVALNGLGRHTEAAALALQALTEADEHMRRTCLDSLVSEAVEARLALGETTADVKAFLLEAIENHGPRPRFLWHLRMLDEQRSETAQYYRLLVHGTLAEQDPLSDEAKGFYSNVDVVADSTAEALAWFRALRPRRVLASLEAEKVEILEPRPRDPKGVYHVSGYSFYTQE